MARGAGALVCQLAVQPRCGRGHASWIPLRPARWIHIVVQLNADGQHDPSYLPELVAGLEHADVVVGARFAGVGDYQVGLFRDLRCVYWPRP
ncbi:hypothetical protein [Aeromicrobium sp. UC242_57]|uniref:hypothetical protein n=1 Tax=Aeromicrobium sp. UC242_57 TaxID=3374624 RepID=UPI00379AFB74